MFYANIYTGSLICIIPIDKQRVGVTTASTTTSLPQELLGKARGWDMFPRTVVLAPSRELCNQVSGVAKKLLAELDEKTITGKYPR